KTAEEKKAARERLAAERAAAKARTDEERKQLLAKLEEMKSAQKARVDEERLRKEADAAAKKLAQEREKRVALEKAQASRVIHLIPGQMVGVVVVWIDLAGWGRVRVSYSQLDAAVSEES